MNKTQTKLYNQLKEAAAKYNIIAEYDGYKVILLSPNGYIFTTGLGSLVFSPYNNTTQKNILEFAIGKVFEYGPHMRVYLDEFTKSYIETALWSSHDDNEDSLSKYSYEDISQDCFNEMIEDCKNFQSDNKSLLKDLNMKTCGHDFWLTRNHHGAGFWDGDYPEPIGTDLTNASHKFNEINLYIGDDNLIYSE